MNESENFYHPDLACSFNVRRTAGAKVNSLYLNNSHPAFKFALAAVVKCLKLFFGGIVRLYRDVFRRDSVCLVLNLFHLLGRYNAVKIKGHFL